MLKVKLLSYTPNPEEVVASAAKLCYSPVGVNEIIEKLDSQNVEKFIEKLVSIKHLSPFEHVSFSFAVEGVSRTLTHQLVRHRLASYSQQSQRYVKETMFDFIVPPSIENNEKAKEIFIKEMENSQKAYDDIVRELMIDKIFATDKYYKWYEKITDIETTDNGKDWDVKEIYKNLIEGKNTEKIDEYLGLFKKEFPKEHSALEKEAIEDARYVFPNAAETKIVVTMNARSLMHFFKLRCCNRAQWEIRALADEMLSQVIKVAPAIFSNSGAPCTFGKCPEGSMSCGKTRSLEDIVNK